MFDRLAVCAREFFLEAIKIIQFSGFMHIRAATAAFQCFCVPNESFSRCLWVNHIMTYVNKRKYCSLELDQRPASMWISFFSSPFWLCACWFIMTLDTLSTGSLINDLLIEWDFDTCCVSFHSNCYRGEISKKKLAQNALLSIMCWWQIVNVRSLSF